MPYKFNAEDNLHIFYVSRTKAIYKKTGHSSFASETDKLARNLFIGLLSIGLTVSEDDVLAMNSLYSQGQPRPSWLYWELVSGVSGFRGFEVPDFYRVMASSGSKDVCLELCAFMRELLVRLLGGTSEDELEYINAVCSALKQVAEAPNPISFIPDVPIIRKKVETGVFEEEVKEKAEATEPEDLDTLLAELDTLTGLYQIKKDVRSLINLVKIRKLRKENELPVAPMSLHMVFTGNPGTGKTTVARLLSRLYHAIGVLSAGTLVEVDRAGLVAGYVGQTAIKTSEAIAKAKGGVLFIDEAYSLAPEGSGSDFGREAIEIILKNMEDSREDLVVIAAGYSVPMERFIDSNPGLASRFGKTFEFPDYNGDELYHIFSSMCEKNRYEPDDEAREYIRGFLNDMYENRGENFGNARDVRNLFEKAVARHSDRVAQIENPVVDDLVTLLKDDIGEEFANGNAKNGD